MYCVRGCACATRKSDGIIHSNRGLSFNLKEDESRIGRHRSCFQWRVLEPLFKTTGTCLYDNIPTGIDVRVVNSKVFIDTRFILLFGK